MCNNGARDRARQVDKQKEPIDYIKIWTQECQFQLKRKDWFPWNFEAAPGGIICTGAVCPLITRGKKKGEPNFRRKDRSTIQKVFVAVKREEK